MRLGYELLFDPELCDLMGERDTSRIAARVLRSVARDEAVSLGGGAREVRWCYVDPWCVGYEVDRLGQTVHIRSLATAAVSVGRAARTDAAAVHLGA